MRGERGHGDVIAFIDMHEVIDERGEVYSCTLRRKDCDILGWSIRCKPCNDFRNSLRSTLSKQQAITKDNTSSISHTNYSHLTSAEKDARLKNLHDSLKVATRKLSTLEGKIKRIMETQAINSSGRKR